MNFYQNSGGRTIQAAFNEFHKNNPAVYKHFKSMVQKAIAKGKKKVSSKLIINVIRWEIYMETIELTLFTDSEGEEHKFRINDAYTSRYARLFIEEFPQHEDLFNNRAIRSA